MGSTEWTHLYFNYLTHQQTPFEVLTFHSRNAEGKDKCDGLIGQAAPIRGLARGGIVLERPELIETAEEVFCLHPFNDQLGLWERVEIDGTRLSFDRTLNHQLTFAAASAELAECGIDTEPFKCLLDRLDRTMRLHSDGLIKHYVRPPLPDVLQTVGRFPEHWGLLWNEIVFHYYSKSESRRKKELGYHPFNLRGLAHLSEAYPNHFVWESETVQNSLIFVGSELYRGSDGVFHTSHGSMTPGIHTSYALWRLGNYELKETRNWIRRDIERKFNFNNNLLVENAQDSKFQASTIYNLCVFPNIEIEFSNNPD